MIPRAPQKPPAYDPTDERYWDPRDLETELRRTFQVCHECRMCVGYCGSFPELFSRVDRDIDRGKAEGAEAIDYEDIKAVGDECWQCKLCYIKCPYTPDEGSHEALDFPRLMARERAVRARRDGVPLVDRILGEPDALGSLASGVLAPLANAGPKLIQASSLLKKVQEGLVGISGEFPVPPFASEGFSTWFARRKPSQVAQGADEVVLFATCYNEHYTPAIARAAVAVLERSGVRVLVPGVGEGGGEERVGCCGMPNLDGGDVAAAQEKIRKNVGALLPHVRQGRRVVVLGPTCGLTLKKEWAEYVPTEPTREVARSALDLMEFLVLLAREKKLDRTFERGLGKVAYHAACHLRAQKIGFPGARLFGLLPDTEVRVIEQCSAVDGTWGMKAKHYETGRKYAQKLVREVAAMEPDVVVSDCTLAGLRVVKENGTPVLHPVQALALAYGIDERAEES